MKLKLFNLLLLKNKYIIKLINNDDWYMKRKALSSEVIPGAQEFMGLVDCNN